MGKDTENVIKFHTTNKIISYSNLQIYNFTFITLLSVYLFVSQPNWHNAFNATYQCMECFRNAL